MEYFSKKNKKQNKVVETTDITASSKDPVVLDAKAQKVYDKAISTLKRMWTGSTRAFYDFIDEHAPKIKEWALRTGVVAVVVALILTMSGCCTHHHDDDFIFDDDNIGIVDNGGNGVLGPDGNYYYGSDMDDYYGDNGYVGGWVGDGSHVDNGGSSYDKDDDYVDVEGDVAGDIIIDSEVKKENNTTINYITATEGSAVVIGDNNTVIIINGNVQESVGTGGMDYVIVKDKEGNIIGIVDVKTGELIPIGESKPPVEDNENDNTGNGSEDEGKDDEGKDEGGKDEGKDESTNPTNPCYVDSLVSALKGKKVHVVSMSVEKDANGEARVFNMDYMGISGKFVSIACALDNGTMFKLQLPIESYHLVAGGDTVKDVNEGDVHTDGDGTNYEKAAEDALKRYGLSVNSNEMSR